jgi:hypothetical protein
MRTRKRSWWRGLLTPAPFDVAERLIGHYDTEMRLARQLAEDSESMGRYPQSRSGLLKMAVRTRGRTERLRRALEGLGQRLSESVPETSPRPSSTWERLRAGVSELSSLSEAYLADAHAGQREHSGIASLMYELHRETARERRDLIWVLSQLGGTAAEGGSLETVAA